MFNIVDVREGTARGIWKESRADRGRSILNMAISGYQTGPGQEKSRNRAEREEEWEFKARAPFGEENL